MYYKNFKKIYNIFFIFVSYFCRTFIMLIFFVERNVKHCIYIFYPDDNKAMESSESINKKGKKHKDLFEFIVLLSLTLILL